MGRMKTLQLQHRCPSHHRIKVRASYVDETLFGRPAGARPTLPDFDPPWVQNSTRTRGVGLGAPTGTSLAEGDCGTPPSRGRTPILTPRKKNKYRLISHTPSYCDESLFGAPLETASPEVSRMATGETAKLRALFWTPPATPRGSHSPRPRETPLRALHSVGPPRTESRVTAGTQKLSEGGLDAPRPLGRLRSHSLTHLSVPSMDPSKSLGPNTNGPRVPRPSTSGVTTQSPLVTPRTRSDCVAGPAAPRQGGGLPKPKPPWK